MPIDKATGVFVPTAPTAPRTAPTAPTQTPTSPTSPAPSPTNPSAPSQPQNPLSPNPPTIRPSPPPAIQANAIVNRVARIVKSQRPEIINSSGMTVTKSSPTVNARGFKRFVVQFDDGSDKNRNMFRLWVKGYTQGGITAGSNPANFSWVLMKVAKSAPIYLDLEASSENILIGVEAINASGDGLLDLDQMPHVLTSTA